jgi:hypothetical protein
MSEAMYMPTKMASSDDVGGMEFSQKQGHSCCNCCCDTRRAVIIVNLVMLCFNLLTALSFVAGVEIMEAAAAQADDDQVIEEGKELQSIPMGLFVALIFLQAVFYVFGIMGAINYTKWMIICAIVGYVLSFAVHLLQLNFLGMLLSGVFAYPHFFFLSEMNQNIMTPENYPNEVQSCCCV